METKTIIIIAFIFGFLLWGITKPKPDYQDPRVRAGVWKTD